MSVERSIGTSQYNEWDFCEDDSGIVYCLGRSVAGDVHEAVAVYERAVDGAGTKQSLVSGNFYNRIMYHGFPEELTRLDALSLVTRESLLGRMSVADTCLYVDTKEMSRTDPQYSSVTHWLNCDDRASSPFQRSLEIACNVLESAGVSLDQAKLYGGASFGLVGAPDKWVDDVDFLLTISSEELLALVETFAKPYDWGEIDPNNILSDRRKTLKAKRWSTSQLRLYVPDFLSVDLKIARPTGAGTLWDRLTDEMTTACEVRLRVVDDKEAFSISPALVCEDAKGQEQTLLFRGYPYIGTAVKDDIITVRGRHAVDSATVIVSQSADDLLVPDLRTTHLVH